MIDRITGFAYLLGWKIVRILPESIAYKLFEKLADRSTRKKGRSYKRLSANLSRIRPNLAPTELDALTKIGMRSYLRYWCDAFRLPSWNFKRLTETVTVEGEEMFRSLVAEGKGVAVSLPHSGNWDHAGAYFSATGIPIIDRKSTRLNSSHVSESRMPSSA